MKLKNLLSALFFLAGLATLVIGIYYTVQTTNLAFIIRFIFAALLGLDAIFYFIAAWGIYKKINWIYIPALVLLVVNVLGLIFDDFGLADALFAIFSIILGAMLVIEKKGSRKEN
jgi:hypothetical protein